jgi:hypothetical protein
VGSTDTLAQGSQQRAGAGGVVSNSPWNEQIAINVSPTPARRPHWPWEQPDYIQRSSDFLREHICEVYLVRAFELRDAKPGASLQKLADILNLEGSTTKEGKPFHAMQVKRILDRKAFYEGAYIYSGVKANGQHQTIL